MENKDGFYYHVNEINKRNDRSGNAAIYNACKNKGKNVFNTADAEFLEGMLWLIGRSYAASPQRRSYGVSSKMKDDEQGKKRAVWPVKTENSGNGDFFAEIADYIVKPKGKSREDLAKLKDCLEKLSSYEKQPYNFDFSKNSANCEDLQRLICVVQSVSLFNRLIKRASERFDCVPGDNIHKIAPKHSKSGVEEKEYVYCKNQISFCSKFLHFFFPNSVFIIDQFSEKGAKIIFPKKTSKKYKFISSTYVDEFDPPENEVFNLSGTIETFKRKRQDIINIIKKIEENEEIKKEFEADSVEIENLKESSVKIEKDSEDVSTSSDKANGKGYSERYLIHCVNSYVLCCLLKGEIEAPVVSFPRLSDSVFMRIKTKNKQNASAKEKRKKIKEIYGI